ncbi:PREDICTED: adenosine receptor A2b-like [Priapulus caudatus]|uniref:Adenosine receptor A2b-like n=1 Tax=Priapulus caudatus TaxID=37621 RepID=A0ABM1E853_PRICU|nr:PREDICTED: adenosine receptor A2b-like [Priapulus caudatus]
MSSFACNASASPLKVASSETVSAVFISANLLLVVAIVVMNLLVIIAILISRKLHTSFHVYIMGLCSSDIVVGSLALPMHIFINYFCPVDLTMYCAAQNIMLYVVDVGFVMTSYTMVAIAVDRYRVVVVPLRHCDGKRSAAVRIGAIFVCAVTYATAMLVTDLEWQKHPEYDVLMDICNVTRFESRSEQAYVFFLIDFISFYCVPLCVSACLYARVILRLWRDTREMHAARDSQVTAGALQRKKRAMKISVCIVIVFAVMWLPYHSTHIYFNIYPHELTQDIWWLLPACNVCYYSNSWMNSVIYVYFSVTFRRELTTRWRSFVACESATQDVRRNSGSVSDAQTSSVASQTDVVSMVTEATSPHYNPLSRQSSVASNGILVTHM